MKGYPKKQAAIVLVGLALGLGAFRWLLPSSAGAASAGARPAASAPAEEEQGPALPARRWQEGEAFVYDLETTRGTEIGGDEQKQQLFHVDLAGKLTLTVIGKAAGEVRLRADLRASRVDANSKKQEDWAGWVSRTFYLTAQPSGAFKEFFFPKDVPAEARALLKGIVLSFQMVAPPAPRAAWRVIEQDVTGQYEAVYRAESASAVAKSKNVYVRTRGLTGLVPLRKDTKYGIKSTTKLGIDASGWPGSLAEDESLDITAQGTRVHGTVKTKARLAATESHPEWIGPLPGDVESDSASEAAAMARSKKQADINMVGGRSFAQIAAGIKADSPKARNQAQARMSALLRVDPSQAAKVSEEVLHGDGDANAKKRLIGALGNAGTAEAQHELAKLLQTDDAGDLRVNAAVSMSLTKHATAETAAALEKVSSSSADRDVANTAILASGNVIRTMNNEGLGDTSDALQRLIDGLASAITDAERALYLAALGNTGDPRALAAIAPYLSIPNVALRAAATGALKFMTVEAADTALIAAMSDPELAVRKAAVHTIPFRPITGVLAAVEKLLETEPLEAVRVEIMKGLSVQITQDSSVIDAVEWAAENDSSQQVKNLAKQILESLGSEAQGGEEP